MIGAIAGDIIGSSFEGTLHPPADFELFRGDCSFTDDTVCTLAVADGLMRDADFAETLRNFVRRYPCAGYGGMFLQWALDEDAPPYGSWGNGAPMRVSAVGWLAETEEQADDLASAQASVSHNHPDAISASQAIARAIFALRHGQSVEAVSHSIAEAFDYDLSPGTALLGGRFDVSARGTAPAALAAAFESNSWEEAVRTAIGLGGDTDTLACIAGAVAEAIHGVPQEIIGRACEYLPEDLRDVLDRFEKRRPPS